MPGLRSGKPSSGRRRNLGKASTLIISSLLLEAPIRCASFPLEYAGGTYRKRPRLGPVGRTVPRSERRVELSAVSRTTNCANKTASMANPPPAFAGAFPPPCWRQKSGAAGPRLPAPRDQPTTNHHPHTYEPGFYFARWPPSGDLRPL